VPRVNLKQYAKYRFSQYLINSLCQSWRNYV